MNSDVENEGQRAFKPDALDKVLDERGIKYGKFINQATIAQDLKYRMTSFNEGRNWHKLTPDQREALEMIAHKIGRILNGDPNYADSWVDIAGYAKLIADRLEGKSR